MTGKEALAYIHNVPWQGTRLGLERTRELMEKLGHPEEKLRFVHIAGTNGKGSTAAMTASVLRAAGYRTGLYTSPYLQVFNERMSVDGEMISDEELGELTEQIRPLAEEMDDPPTEFEMITALAMLYFLRQKCDIVVLEVGMGGRLDSTNVIPAPAAAVICNIGLDHTAELGDTVEKIAFEKAGIIKEGTDVVLYRSESAGVEQVIRQVCRERKAALHIADFSALRLREDSVSGQTFSYQEHRDLKIRLLGAHQIKNAAVVLEVTEVLRHKGFEISEDALRRGLAAAMWPGRFELLRTAPAFIADGGHNRQCVEAVRAALEHYFPGRKVRFIMGVLADKDYASMIELLTPLAERFYTVTPDSPRALPAQKLAEQLEKRGSTAAVCDSAEDAVARALKEAGAEDVICSVGSLYMTGAVRQACMKLQK